MARCFVSKNDIWIIDGRSTLKNQYSYEAIQTDTQYGSPGNSAFPDYKSVSFSWPASRPAGTTREEVSAIVEGVRNLIGTGLVDFVGGLFTALIAFGLLVRINTALTFLALGFLLVFCLILRKAFNRFARFSVSAERSTPRSQDA